MTVTGTGQEHRLARLTRVEALERAATGAIGVIPLASFEQHGNHLPLGTDALLVNAVRQRAASRCGTDVLITPPICTGFSPHHLPFAATVSVEGEFDGETLLALFRDTIKTLRSWLPNIAIVNGHGGNRGLLQTIALTHKVAAVSYWELAQADAADSFGGDRGSIGHAGQAESSMMLALDPNAVGQPGKQFEPVPNASDLADPQLGRSGVSATLSWPPQKRANSSLKPPQTRLQSGSPGSRHQGHLTNE